MSLREEMLEYLQGSYLDPDSYEDIINDFIKMFKKRIDELMKIHLDIYEKAYADVFNMKENKTVNYGIEYLKALNDVKDLLK